MYVITKSMCTGSAIRTILKYFTNKEGPKSNQIRLPMFCYLYSSI